MNSIFKRRSVRKFQNKEIEDAKIELIIKAGMQAPSSKNSQPWEFAIIKNPIIKEQLATIFNDSIIIKNANTIIITLGNETRNTPSWQQDLAASTQNILLEATELELGSVWLNTIAFEERVEQIRSLLKLDSDLIPFSTIALGYPLDENANEFVDRFNSERIHYFK